MVGSVILGSSIPGSRYVRLVRIWWLFLDLSSARKPYCLDQSKHGTLMSIRTYSIYLWSVSLSQSDGRPWIMVNVFSMAELKAGSFVLDPVMIVVMIF